MEKIIPSLVSSHCMDFSNGGFCEMTVHITASKKCNQTDYLMYKNTPHNTVSKTVQWINFSQWTLRHKSMNKANFSEQIKKYYIFA